MEDNPNLGEEPEVRARTSHTGGARAPITRERIAERAYLISQSEQGSDDDENGLRAERELMEEQEPEEG